MNCYKFSRNFIPLQKTKGAFPPISWMNKIKYSYCLNENNKLIHISSVTVENRHSHIFRCLECGQELIAKIGKIKAPHFAHGKDVACNGESYLHKLAKRRICEKFLFSESFPITFNRDVTCSDAKMCPCYVKEGCITENVPIHSDLKRLQGKVIYDTCLEEVRIGEFQPDILLTCSSIPERGPVFIEIFKTHQSEEPKLTSGYRIVETMQIKSEEDIDNIIDQGFIEGENCCTFNFNPKLPSIKKKDIPIDRFVLFKTGAAKVYRALDYNVMCDRINQRVHSQSIQELNMKERIDIWGDIATTHRLDSYQTGLVYFVKKGIPIKNCILCRYYKYNDYYSNYICVLYKTLGAPSPFTHQTIANTCPRYELNQELMNHPLSELEKEVSEVPM